MIKGGRRLRAKSSSRQTKKIVDMKEKSVTKEDIRTFLPVKSGVIRESSPSPEVSVPSPDDAALPKPSLSSLNEKQSKQIVALLPSPKKGNDKLSQESKTLIPVCECNGFHRSDNEEDRKLLTHYISTSFRKQRKNEAPVKSQLKEYFPVRRSNRKTLCNVKKEKEKLVEEAIISGKEDGFEVKEFPNKGRGVVTKKSLKRGDFVLEYAGELIDFDEAKTREAQYAAKANTGCYMYYFKYGDKKFCIDATKESSRLGRLVNHSKKGNLKTQPFLLDNEPHLILVACRDIAPGEELLYDYGDRSKSSLEYHPWLAL